MKKALIFLVFISLAPLLTFAKEKDLKDISLTTFTPKPLPGTTAVSIADLQKHVVIIDFWASWCGPCKEALPHYNQLFKQYQDQGLLILGVNEDDSAKDRDEFLKAHPVNFSVFADDKREFSQKLGVEALPSLYVLNKKSEIVLHLRGLSKKNTQALDDKIKALLKESL